MAKGNWWFKLEWSDWLSDEKLNLCSFETQGFWMRCICIMHRSDQYELTGTIDQLRRLLGCLPEEVTRCASDLKNNGAADVRFGNGEVSIKSRRLEREHKAREQNRLYVAKHREKDECKVDVRRQSKSKSLKKEKKKEKTPATRSDTKAASPTKQTSESGTKDSRSGHPAIQAFRLVSGRFPDKALYDRIIKRLGDAPDTDRLAKCWVEWVECGYNKNSAKWLNWYLNGIPQRGSVQVSATQNVPVVEIDAEEQARRAEQFANQGYKDRGCATLQIESPQ